MQTQTSPTSSVPTLAGDMIGVLTTFENIDALAQRDSTRPERTIPENCAWTIAQRIAVTRKKLHGSAIPRSFAA